MSGVLALILLCVLVWGAGSRADAGSGVSAVTLVVSPTTAGSDSAVYTVSFTTSSTGALGPNSYLDIKFPYGTVFAADLADYSITAASGAATVTEVYQINTASSQCCGTDVRVNLGSSTIGNNDPVTLTARSVGNPIVASDSWTANVGTSAESTWVPSPPYSITPSAPTSVFATRGGEQEAAVGQQFRTTLAAVVHDTYGNPVSGVPVTFTAPPNNGPGATPTGTFPSTGCGSAPADNQCIVVTDESGSATAAPLLADNVTGSYTVDATTTGSASTATYLLSNSTSASAPTQLAPGTVFLGASAGQGTNYLFDFTTSASGAITGNGTITLTGPNGTSLSSSASDYTVTDATVANAATAAVQGPGSATVSSTANQVQLAITNATITAGLAVQVRTCPAGTCVGNPTEASVGYIFAESTSSDQDPALSPGYSVPPGVATQVVVVSGNDQYADTGTVFAQPLVVREEDSYGNGVPEQSLGFLAPTSGPSVTFDEGGGNTGTGLSDMNGVASSPHMIANGTPGGPYGILARNSLPPASGSTAFDVTNTGGQVTPTSVSPDSSETGAAGVTYSIGFTTSSTGAIPAGGTLTVAFPPGTGVPQALADYAVTAQVGSPTISNISIAGSTAIVTLGTSGIAAGDAVTLTVAAVMNPSTASSYHLVESTSIDTKPAASPEYAINPPPPPPPACPTGVTHLASGQPWAVAAMTATLDGRTCAGYWVVTRTGGVTVIGAAPWLGDMTGHALNAAMIGIAATPAGNGYYLLGADGGIFTYGDATFHGSTGSMRLNAPVVSMAVTPDGGGYWLAASDGGIFTFGDAPFYGSMGGQHLNQPVVGMSADSHTGGYWLVASDGGIFTYNTPFYGSMGGQHLNQPVVGMSPQPGGGGYRLVASDGGVFDFGDATFYGSLPGQGVQNPQITTMATSVDGNGYYLINGAGTVWTFGDAPYLGNA